LGRAVAEEGSRVEGSGEASLPVEREESTRKGNGELQRVESEKESGRERLTGRRSRSHDLPEVDGVDSGPNSLLKAVRRSRPTLVLMDGSVDGGIERKNVSTDGEFEVPVGGLGFESGSVGRRPRT